MNIEEYWESTLKQRAEEMRKFFHPKAKVRFHNTNEEFTVDEFIEINCEYPGSWNGVIERIEKIGRIQIIVVQVFDREQNLFFHVTSFMEIEEDKIISIDEYWGEDGCPPQWRLDKKIGKRIK
ncbi:nuclear transport factor 2 family protein [Fusobacterium necrophorum]|uniref:nuclear transport factor 2 family protein n=1 Tax=Fusobacterium necrophorum TaxID=859 RepID=UPI00254F7F41|nr:nuclear transport factor 2 family protein [Fusobacterium necrophorum]MDK4521271.1 nuclear transport factor 2 family protein [Fusobacterium necrophorum]